MCTGLSMKNGDFYFGRNLDLDYDFGQSVVITPRNYPFTFKKYETLSSHYGMIGMATIVEDYPLYAEAINEKGLGMAGLNFAGYAKYADEIVDGKNNITAYEIIPWVLCKFATVDESLEALNNLNMINIPFRPNMPCALLHWILSDENKSVVLEVTKDGVKIYDNPVGVLTNNPTFDYHLTSLRNYMNLNADSATNNFSKELDLKPLGVGVGAFGLPGDFSPNSRFIKAAFLRQNSKTKKEEEANVAQFFHILDAVAMVRGAVIHGPEEFHETKYSCCCNGRTGDFYYKTYNKLNVTKVSMFAEDLDSTKLISKGYNA